MQQRVDVRLAQSGGLEGGDRTDEIGQRLLVEARFAERGGAPAVPGLDRSRQGRGALRRPPGVEARRVLPGAAGEVEGLAEAGEHEGEALARLRDPSDRHLLAVTVGEVDLVSVDRGRLDAEEDPEVTLRVAEEGAVPRRSGLRGGAVRYQDDVEGDLLREGGDLAVEGVAAGRLQPYGSGEWVALHQARRLEPVALDSGSLARLSTDEAALVEEGERPTHRAIFRLAPVGGHRFSLEPGDPARSGPVQGHRTLEPGAEAPLGHPDPLPARSPQDRRGIAGVLRLGGGGVGLLLREGRRRCREEEGEHAGGKAGHSRSRSGGVNQRSRKDEHRPTRSSCVGCTTLQRAA